MESKQTLTHLSYHKRNIILLVIYLLLTILLTFFITDNKWDKLRIAILPIVLLIIFIFISQHKQLEKNKSYQEIYKEGTLKAFTAVFFFTLLLNPIVQTPYITQILISTPQYLKSFIGMIFIVILLIRECIVFSMCKKNGIS